MSNKAKEKVREALHAYLFNVEYGYAPKEGEDKCKKKGMFSKEDKVWEDPFSAHDKGMDYYKVWYKKFGNLRVQDNLLPINKPNTGKNMLSNKGTYSDSEDKKSLRMKLKAEIEKWLKIRNENRGKANFDDVVRELLALVHKFSGKDRQTYEDNQPPKSVKYPYYCTTSKKGKTSYTKVGEWLDTLGGVAELLYVTEFEEKLYHVQVMLMNMDNDLIEEFVWRTTNTFYTLAKYDQSWVILRVGNETENRTNFVDIKQRKKRREGLNEWAAKRDEAIKKYNARVAEEEREAEAERQKQLELTFSSLELFRSNYSDALYNKIEEWINELRTSTTGSAVKQFTEKFNEAAKKQGWVGKENGKEIGLMNYIEDSRVDNYTNRLLNGMKAQPSEKLKTMRKFVLEFDINTFKVDVNLRDMVEVYVEEVPKEYKGMVNMNLDSILNAETFLSKRSKKFQEKRDRKSRWPMTIKRLPGVGDEVEVGKKFKAGIDRYRHTKYETRYFKGIVMQISETSLRYQIEVETLGLVWKDFDEVIQVIPEYTGKWNLFGGPYLDYNNRGEYKWGPIPDDNRVNYNLNELDPQYYSYALTQLVPKDLRDKDDFIVRRILWVEKKKEKEDCDYICQAERQNSWNKKLGRHLRPKLKF